MLFISPPFGNYFGLLFNSTNIQPIYGTYTKKQRTGLIKQIYNTLHYSNQYNGWVNRIGLRNPGIMYAIQKQYGINNGIVSIAIKDSNDINYYLQQIPSKTNIEINISCPNTNVIFINDIKKFLNPSRKWCIVKLSPIDKNEKIDTLYKIGFRQFHCCNTLPLYKSIENNNEIVIGDNSSIKNKSLTLVGGLSGPSLIPYVKEKITYIKSTYPDTTVIAGGGIHDIDTLLYYKQLGADHFSISSLCFSPLKLLVFFYNYNQFVKERNK